MQKVLIVEDEKAISGVLHSILSDELTDYEILVAEDGLEAYKLLEKDDFSKMGQIIQGADAWYLQKFKSDTELVDPLLQGKAAFSSKEMAEMAEIGSNFVKICQLR